MQSTDTSEQINTILNELRRTHDLRVWSVIVTIMGDIARGDGETVSGATLNTLMDAIGIRPEATRVALHRLRKDGWINSTRAGRGSLYSLTAFGRAETLAVTDKIYGPALPAPQQWHLALTTFVPNKAQLEADLFAKGFVQAAPDVFLGSTRPPQCEALMHFRDSGPKLPEKTFIRLISTSLAQEAEALYAKVAEARQLPHRSMSNTTKAALRILVLHHWRRIALRLPEIPLPRHWMISKLRSDTHQLLNQLGPIECDV